MSQENVELARESFRRFQAEDPGWVEWVDPDIGWDFSAYPLADLPTVGRGRDALLKEVLATYYSGWRDLRQEIREVIDAGDDVIVVIHETARLLGSDAALEREVSHVWTVREGKWIFWRLFATREEALEAAGLRE
jgi:ketosteroid isomerase-like protein